MSDDEKVKVKEAEAEKKRAELAKLGHFECALCDYPGYFKLPNPFLDRHMKIWWEVAVNPLKKLSEFDWAFYDGEWQAAVELIRDFGEWEIEGVPAGDLTTDGVPAIVKAWVMQEANAYIYPFLPYNIRRKMLGIM